MALPELLLPSSLPAFMASAHVLTPEGLYSQVPRMSGSDRRRRVWTSAPRILEASLEVTQAQLEDFYAWHEGPLRAGEVSFTAAVAKPGTGIEYWAANCLSFKVEHLAGSHHRIDLRLRLRGTPESSPPTVSSMYAEVVVALDFAGNAEYLNLLTAEVLAGLEVTWVDGAALAAEAAMRLYTVFDGPSTTHTMLDAEVYVALEYPATIEPSAALDAEVSAGLLTTFLADILLTAEVSAGLLLTVGAGAGPVASPGSITEIGEALLPAQMASLITLQVWADGRVYTKDNDYGALYQFNWYEPTRADYSPTYWVKIGNTLGFITAATGPNAGGWHTLDAGTVNVLWSLYRNSMGSTTDTAVLVQIASDPDGVNIVSSFTVTLTATLSS